MKKSILLLLTLATLTLTAQSVPCNIAGNFTSTGDSIVLDNRNNGCYQWRVAYTSTGFSALSISLQVAPASGNAPGTFADFTGATVVTDGINPSTAITQAIIGIHSNAAFVKVHLATATGSGKIIYQVWGANSTSNIAGVSSGSGSGVTPSQIQTNSFNLVTVAGMSPTYTGTMTPSLTAYTVGMVIWVADSSFTCNGQTALTLNINGKGAKSIYDSDEGDSFAAPLLSTCNHGGTGFFPLTYSTGGNFVYESNNPSLQLSKATLRTLSVCTDNTFTSCVPMTATQGTTSNAAIQTGIGSTVAGNCPQYDATGTLVDSGAPCGGGGGGGGFTTQTVLTATNVSNTIYQNTGTTARFVTIGVFNAGGLGAGQQIKILTDSSNPPTTNILQVTEPTGSLATGISFIVLPGNFYELLDAGGASAIGINSWTENN